MPIQMVRDDITTMKCDAIVNAAKNSLLGGGGVDGAIHKAAGPELLEECKTLGGCKTGDAKITKGYNLPAKYVIHTVGPIWHGGLSGEPEALASCYRSSLNLAKENNIKSIAFPMISCGIYGYPVEKGIDVAINECSEFLKTNEMDIYLIVFSEDAVKYGKVKFPDLEEYISRHFVEEKLNKRMMSNMPDLLSESADIAGMASKDSLPYDDYDDCCTCAMSPDSFQKCAATISEHPEEDEAVNSDLNNLLKKKYSDGKESFSMMVFRKIDELGMTEVECYNAANVTKSVFSKIRNHINYQPTKTTALAFAIALKLNLKESKELLQCAGYALSMSNEIDIIVTYFIQRRYYNLASINMILDQKGLPCLGSCSKGK